MWQVTLRSCEMDSINSYNTLPLPLPFAIVASVYAALVAIQAYGNC